MILCCGEALIDMIPAPVAGGNPGPAAVLGAPSATGPGPVDIAGAGDAAGPDTDAGREIAGGGRPGAGGEAGQGGDPGPAQGFVPHPGGAVFNTAIALGRLGVATGMVTGLSRDLFGQQLAAALAASGVATDRVILSDRPTTLAFVRLENGQATYTFYDENSAGRMISAEDMPPADEAAALFLGGISLAVEPAADSYAGLLAREAQGRAVMIDPNIRPGFVPDRARYVARLQAMMAVADIVKLSDEDLAWLYPQGNDRTRVAAVRDLGPSVVIVTRGGAGAEAWLADGRTVTVPARRATVVDTVGAGDTFNAGVLAALSQAGLLTPAALRDLTPPQLQAALEFGARVAAVTVSRAGANPPWLQELGAG